jgi:hypothetical protein
MWNQRRRDHVVRNRFSPTHPGVEPILEVVDQSPLGDLLTAIDDAALKAKPKWPPYFYGV